jgi:hypothetical protein
LCGEGDGAPAAEVVAAFGDVQPPREGVHIFLAVADGAAQIAPVVRALDEAGYAIAHLTLVEPTLDDVFLEKTGRHLEGSETAAELGPEPAPEDGPAESVPWPSP